jgi:hypothetical protein
MLPAATATDGKSTSAAQTDRSSRSSSARGSSSELDEERSAGGAAAHDEVTGLLRTRAIDAARAVSGPGTARSVERERDGSIEVDVVAKDRSIVEVELDSELRVTDIDEEDLYDE